MRFATLVDKKRGVHDDKVHMNQLENRQARYRSNTWMGRTRTDGPDEFKPSKFDCIIFDENRLPADDSHEILCLICYFLKSSKI